MSEHVEHKEEKEQKKESINVPSWTWNVLIMFCLVLFVVLWISSCDGNEENITENSFINNYNQSEFSKEGEGTATIEKPEKAWLSPSRSYFRILEEGKAKIVFKSNPNIFLICDQKPNNTEQAKKWEKMPSGEYFVFPYESNTIIVSWWLKN